MSNAAEFLTSNLINAKSLEADVRIEATVIAARPREFEDGSTKLTLYTDYQSKGVVLNQGRLKKMIAAFGPNYSNWVGKQIIIFQGWTVFQGENVPCVEIDPVRADRLGRPGAQQRSASRSDFHSGRNPPPPPPDHYDGPDNRGDDTPFDDEIPY
jgi:hypothetical protein